ncbi:hypothetical protein NDU88_006928 [Pleurodeles waltl]|uniref:Uncharacterized protein n=1 Tax=Pleurodeles waltl TaxID=8319 RepID=A0AAV7N0M4_PLEWA|nr:hypothetical protein NDU88_006928 [Pleurodeles waltl]
MASLTSRCCILARHSRELCVSKLGSVLRLGDEDDRIEVSSVFLALSCQGLSYLSHKAEGSSCHCSAASLWLVRPVPTTIHFHQLSSAEQLQLLERASSTSQNQEVGHWAAKPHHPEVGEPYEEAAGKEPALGLRGTRPADSTGCEPLVLICTG